MPTGSEHLVWRLVRAAVSAAIVMVAFSLSPFAQEAVPPFAAPPERQGSVQVKLYPTDAVKPGSTVLVTFGMPFTRGSITQHGLRTVRVTGVDGREIPTYVDQLTPWRHVTDESRDGGSVRVARIQLEYTFSAIWPSYETVTVSWGGGEWSADRSTLTDPKSAWHLVDDGEFSAEDGVMEPDVYAVLPADILCKGTIKPMRIRPFADVPPQRETPAAFVKRIDGSGYDLADHARHNFFYTIINRDDSRVVPGNLCPYKTQSEPWLYDRSSAMFMLYLAGGNVTALREAVRNTQYYLSKLYDDTTRPERFVGLFRLKTPKTEGYPTGNGAMYSYNECLAYTYWLTCDDSMLAPIRQAVSAHEMNDEPTRWNPSVGFWTERHTALRLLANTVAYEVTGAAVYRDNITRQYRDFIRHQNGADGLLPENRVDGALWHYGGQHGDGADSLLVASSWMTVLTVDAMVRAYAFTGDREIADFVRRVGTFENAACKRDDMHSYGDEPLWYCDYMVRFDGASEMRSGHTIEHSLEIAGAVAWSAYFARMLGQDDQSLIDLADRLFASYREGVRHWTRPAGPEDGAAAYRVSPWRKYGWEYRPSASLSWIMESLKRGGK